MWIKWRGSTRAGLRFVVLTTLAGWTLVAAAPGAAGEQDHGESPSHAEPAGTDEPVATILETRVADGKRERWTISTGVLGLPRLAREVVDEGL